MAAGVGIAPPLSPAVPTSVRLSMPSSFLTLSRHASVRLAEIAFLLLLIAGIWMVVAELMPRQFHRTRMVVAGAALAASGVLLLVATHWGQFG